MVKEIVGEEEKSSQILECKHCKGSGKCNCYTCVYDFYKVVKDWNLRDYEYRKILEENPHFTVKCSKCDGFGAYIVDSEGNIKLFKEKK